MTAIRIRTALLALILAITAIVTPNVGATAQRDVETVSIWRVFVDDQTDVNRLASGEFDLLEGRGDGYLLVIGEAGVADDLRGAGFRIKRDRVLSAAPGVEAKLSLDGKLALAQTYFGGYRTVDEHVAHLNSVASLYPNLTTLVDYGDSWLKTQGQPGGNDLYAICITNKQAGDCALNPNSAKPRAVIQAATHARELQTSEVAWRLIDELTQNYGSDADITYILDTTEVWVIPVVNPDGREIVESGGNSPYLQRKNANNSVGNCSVPPSSGNQHGVDLNRNATFEWGGIGTSTNPCSAVYRGTGPASEPEQEALEDLFENLWPDQKGAIGSPAPVTATGSFITIHSFGNLVLLPPGISGIAPNDAQLRAFAFRMSHYNGYTTGTGPEILYGVSGATDDDVYFRLGVPGFTYELSPSSGACSGFTPAYSCVDSSIWPLNRDALIYSAKVAGTPYITPRGPTTTTVSAGGPVEAGNPLTISATVNDNAFGNASGSFGRPSAQTVTAAEYYIDNGPTQGGTGIAMSVSDGSFNENNEGVQANIDTTGLSAGEHVALIRGQNAGGFWGPITAVSFSVTEAVDDPPTANAQSVSVVEDVATAITLTGSDPENGPLTYAIASGPSNGSLSGAAPNVTYTPNSGYVGSDSFTFTVDDGTTTSPAATVSITVTEFNVAPTADSASVNVDEDGSVGITLTGADGDGDPITFSVSSSPSDGSLSGTAPNLTYTPDADFNGSDNFTFVTNDGTVNSATATISISVDPVNDAPVATGESLDVVVATSTAVRIDATDVDGDALSYAITSGPANGSLSGTAPDLIYTPDNGYIGADQFSFTANDGTAASNAATVTIDVTDIAEGPVFQDNFDTDPQPGQSWSANPNGTDTATTGIWERGNPQATNSSGPKQLDITTSGSNALVTAVIAGSSVGVQDVDNGVTSMWSPEIALPTGLGLELSFDYYMAHTSNSSTADFFRMTVVGNTNTVVVEELGAANDDDGAWIGANVDISAYAGQTIRLLIEASDAANGSIVEAAVDTLLINGVRPPTADAQSVTTAEDTAAAITLTGSDPGGDPLTYSVASGPSNGSLSGTAPNLTYTPNANFNGIDSFTFTVNDGTSSSPTATVSIDVTAVNDAPTAGNVSVTTQQDTATSVTLVGNDVDGDALNYTTSNGPSNGSLSGTAPNLTYTPNAGYQGGDSFTYTVSDGNASDQATVSITVTPVVQGGTVFFDDFEGNLGWVTNPDGTDTATTGFWEVANPQGTSSSGTKQRNDTTSGVRDLVTAGTAGTSAGRFDIDNGTTSVRSPDIALPTGLDLELSFDYYFSHRSNSTSADFLRVTVVGSSSQVVFQELGAGNDDDAVWAAFTGSLNQFAGQTVYLLVEAADEANGSLVEAALDDVRIEAIAP